MTARRARALADAWERRRPDQVCPVFYVAQDLRAPPRDVEEGHVVGPAGSPDHPHVVGGVRFPDDGRPWHELPFVTTLVCPTMDVANEVIARGMRLDEAEAYVAQWLEANAA